MLFNVTSLPPKKILATSQPITIINKQITFLMELNYKPDIEINAELAFDKFLMTKLQNIRKQTLRSLPRMTDR